MIKRGFLWKMTSEFPFEKQFRQKQFTSRYILFCVHEKDNELCTVSVLNKCIKMSPTGRLAAVIRRVIRGAFGKFE